MTSQVRALYTWCVTLYNDKPIDLCFTIYVLSALLSAVVTQRVKVQFMNKYMLYFTLLLNILPESDAASAILAQTMFHIIVQLSSTSFK